MGNYYIGIDIGGTKCRVSLGKETSGEIEIIKKMNTYPTSKFSVEEMLEKLKEDVSVLKENVDIKSIGISCGGPLNSKKGIIMSPPNLIGWDNVPIVEYFSNATGIPTRLCNDANAGALAEWMFGAGKGADSIVFLTFGTGMGAGLILNQRLYEGASDMAGEIGHVRIASHGPVGYGKIGSFEGFCSGGGIAQYAKSKVLEEMQQGKHISWVSDIDNITAKDVGLAANANDKLAIEIMKEIGTYLGKGLSILIDILNPDRIIIGSIYARNERLLSESVHQVINKEALIHAANVCDIRASELGESIGDMAALTVAVYFYKKELNNER